MDPLLLLAEWWWTAPVAVGGVTAGAVGLHRRSVKSGRRLAYDAARLDLRTTRAAVIEKSAAVDVARADHAHTAAERGARRASPEQVAAARRRLRDAERDLKAANAEVRAKQARVRAARAAIPRASAPRPLDRLRAQHDAVVAQWLRYETDTGLQIAYPAMTDVRQPATAAYLRAAGEAVDCRREVEGTAGPAEFAAYRDAVERLEQAFDVAERVARGETAREPQAGWQDAAQDLLDRSVDAMDRAAGAAASALAAWTARGRRGDDRDPRS